MHGCEKKTFNLGISNICTNSPIILMTKNYRIFMHTYFNSKFKKRQKSKNVIGISEKLLR